MKGNIGRRSRYATLLLASLMLTACGKQSESGNDRTPVVAPTELSVGILLFGDSGYHLDYPDQNDFEDLFSDEEFQQSEWLDWIEDKRPQDEYEARPTSISPVTGKTVPATGLHAIALAMKNYCRDTQTCDFGALLGDNIYPSGATLGADGKDDAQRFRDMFTIPFAELVTNPSTYLTYVTLGNHDWETSRAAGFSQIAFLENEPGFYMDGAFYTVKPPAGNGEIELFVIDTSMLLASVPVFADSLNDDGSEVTTNEVEAVDYHVEPLTDAERAMPEWLENALRESTARWKIVVAHHPIWSSSGSKFEQARVLRQLLLPAMCRYADAYLVGHDHTLEVHTDSCEAALGTPAAQPLVQIVSGAAAKQRPIHTTFMQKQDEKYPEHKTLWAEGLLWGFAHLQIDGDNATVRLLSVPDDGSSTITQDFEYQFTRRSGD